MVPLWFTLSALCFVGAVVLLYVDIDRRRGRSRRRKSWARSHGFDYERESTEILKRWTRGVMSTVGDVAAHNVVLGQIRGEAVYIFDLEEVATVIALHRKVGTNVVVDLRLKGLKEPRESDIWLLGAIGPRMVYSTNLDAARRACDRRMVTFAHTAPDCAEIMWNEQNWTLVSMPIASTRAQWDEGLRTVRQFNDLLRVLPPLPQEMPQQTGVGPRGAGHGVSGVHAAACPFAGADCPLDGIDVGATHQTARARSDRLEGVNDGDVSFATVGELGPAGQNRARVEEHRRQIQSCGGHQHSGQRFVASGQQHRTVESFGLHHDFDAVGDHLTGNQREVHPLMTHGDAVRNRDRAELKRIAAGRKHPLLDRVGQPVQ